MGAGHAVPAWRGESVDRGALYPKGFDSVRRCCMRSAVCDILHSICEFQEES